MDPQLADARTFLFVPGNRPDRFSKAIASGADAVVFDLEDSVPPADKQAARRSIVDQWVEAQRSGVPLVVRMNPESAAEAPADLAALQNVKGLAAVMVPKAESPQCLARVRDALNNAVLIPLIESAAGYEAVNAIAAVPSVLRLAVGHIDYMADTGIVCDEDESELVPLRHAVAIATRIHGLAAAIDGVTSLTGDGQRLRGDVLRARRFGFGAKLCIHPQQVAVVHAAMAPTPQELEWAHRVVEADRTAGGAAVQLDGRMVDRPIVLLAQRQLALARRS